MGFQIENGILKKYTEEPGVTEITIPEDVTDIGEYVFYNCRQLETVRLSRNTVRIRKGAFANCCSLKTVSFAGTAAEIGESAFRGCWSLSEVGNLRSAAHIGDRAFQGCRQLKDAAGAVIVCGILFDYYTDGKLISVSDEVTEISSETFENVVEIEEVYIRSELLGKVWKQISAKEKPIVAANCIKNSILCNEVKTYIRKNPEKVFDSIVRLSDSAAVARFMDIAKVRDADTIDGFLQKVRASAECTAFLLQYKAEHFPAEELQKQKEQMTEMEVGLQERTAQYWKTVFKFTDKNGSITITGYLRNEAAEEVPGTIDGKPVTVIAKGAFKGKTNLQEIHLPDSLEAIEENAFKGCSNLQSVVIPPNTERIGPSAFEGCSSLESCQIPEGVSRIGGDAFKNCTALHALNLPQKLDLICVGLFDGCSALETVEIPDSITKVCDYAFRNCRKLRRISLPGSVEEIGYGAFTACRALEKITLPDKLTGIMDYAFRNCTKLTEVSIPASAERIGRNTFSDCKKLTIHGSAGSRAESYAAEHQIPFIAE